jgi:hypothetical protein
LQELTHSTIIADPNEHESGIPELLQGRGLHVVFEDIGTGCYMVIFGFFRQLARRVPHEEVMTANETRNLKALLPPIPALGVHRLSLFLGDEDAPQSPDTPQEMVDLCAALSTSGVQSLWLKDNNGIASFLTETAMIARPLYALEREPPLFTPDGKLPFHLRKLRKKKSLLLIEQQLEFTRRIIGVDEACAERLLRRFQSVKRVICATIEELLEDEGVGWMQIHHRWEMMTAPMTAQ